MENLIEKKADLLILDDQYSEVFDRIYRAQQGGDPVIYNPSEPFIRDVREMIAGSISTKSNNVKSFTKRKQGRNELCACGSGKKYKRCCWKK